MIRGAGERLPRTESFFPMSPYTTPDSRSAAIPAAV